MISIVLPVEGQMRQPVSVRPSLTRKLRTWYGLSLTLRLYGTHWAAVGPGPPHPQLVNMLLRIYGIGRG
ncbi:hypothetical protein BMS3Abin14_01548 [bacterium BMS3Abin14]|nr:hypothetical protein BMS3Abin14_01548 [bacterium BMS3Abin14]